MTEAAAAEDLYECPNCGRNKFVLDVEGRCPACYSQNINVMSEESLAKANRPPWYLRWLKKG